MSNSIDSDNTTEEKQTRREMCGSLIRYSILGCIGLVWAGLYIRSARNSATTCCSQSLSCGGCTLLEQCNLPKAEKTRNFGSDSVDVTVFPQDPPISDKRQ
jgi:hypothetical protein